jgi:RsmE family RNA methyltransferase
MSIDKQLWSIILPDTKFYPQSEILLKDDEFHYLSKVLRLNVNEEIEINNCSGFKAKAIIQSISKKEATIFISEVNEEKKQEPTIKLYLAMTKPSTLEEIVLSASEMGLAEMHIFRSDKCASKAPLKTDKLQKISHEATRISKSAYSTQLYFYDSLKELFEKEKNNIENGFNLFCDENHVYEKTVSHGLLKTLQDKYFQSKNIQYLVGPEASFSAQEREFILKYFNAHSVSLGPNILRVPTAVCSSLGVIFQFIGR